MTEVLKALTSASPDQKQSMAETMDEFMRYRNLRLEKMLPAKVISYDRVKNVAIVQPMIVWIKMDDTTISRNPLAQISVMSMGAGGFHINFPVKQGDLGWIFAPDRDLTLFKQSLTEQRPNTGRCHTFQDGMFIPDVFFKYTVNAEDSDAMVIQSTDGATRISIRSDNIKITAPVKVLVDVPLTEFTNDVKIDGNLEVDGNQTTTGFTTVNGGFDATGGADLPCNLPPTAQIGGIVVIGHGHEQNGDSGRTSGGMEA